MQKFVQILTSLLDCSLFLILIILMKSVLTHFRDMGLKNNGEKEASLSELQLLFQMLVPCPAYRKLIARLKYCNMVVLAIRFYTFYLFNLYNI